jgi:tRNA-dihydrouridine synthase B
MKHYNNLVDLKGEYVAVREMRKHISYYIKGVPNATEMRRKINETTEKTEVVKILEENLINVD